MRGTLLTIAAALLLFLAAEPTDAVADVRYRFFHFNVCGAKCEKGNVARPANAIRRSILDQRPAAVSLNEVCFRQFAGLRKRLRRSDYAMHGRFVTTLRRAENCDGGSYGNAILTRARIRRRVPIDLPNLPEDGEQRKGVCGLVELERLALICTVHLANPRSGDAAREEIRFAQARMLAQISAMMAAEVGVLVLMGDLNYTPEENAIAPLYEQFREVDEADDEPTLGDAKLDYIFVSRGAWVRPSGDATRTTTRSDHVPLRGAATLRPR